MRSLASAAFLLSILTHPFQSALASDISILATPPDNGNFSSTPEVNKNNSYLLLSGEIQKGDAEKLANVLVLSHPFGTQLYLDSPGGDVEESLQIAALVKALHVNTVVAGGGTCASACFFIFLAGDSHVAPGTGDGRLVRSSFGYLGLHRPHLKLGPAKEGGSKDAEARQHDVMQKISTYLRNEDVPQRLIDLMMSRSSNEIYWMTQDDIDQLGSFSPSLEELLISRCGYSRNMIQDGATAMVMARQKGDSVGAVREKERLKASAEALGQCEASAFPDLMQESFKNTKRLKKGWRPWLESKAK
jgi:hypothetical protein